MRRISSRMSFPSIAIASRSSKRKQRHFWFMSFRETTMIMRFLYSQIMWCRLVVSFLEQSTSWSWISFPSKCSQHYEFTCRSWLLNSFKKIVVYKIGASVSLSRQIRDLLGLLYCYRHTMEVGIFDGSSRGYILANLSPGFALVYVVLNLQRS